VGSPIYTPTQRKSKYTRLYRDVPALQLSIATSPQSATPKPQRPTGRRRAWRHDATWHKFLRARSLPGQYGRYSTALSQQPRSPFRCRAAARKARSAASRSLATDQLLVLGLVLVLLGCCSYWDWDWAWECLTPSGPSFTL
jgi:hypothetical protein